MAGKDYPKTLKKASLRKAESIVDGYRIMIEPNEGFGYVGSALDFPTGFGRGKTREECLEETKEILKIAVAIMLDLGGIPPRPAGAQGRTAQINIRVTPAEKDLIKRASTYYGYRDIAEFIRTTTMTAVQSVFKFLSCIIL